MAHIILEHSKGVAKSINVKRLLDGLHGEAMAHPSLPLGGIRTRTYCPEYCLVADGEAGREFIYIVVRLGFGRTEEVRRNVGETLFKFLTDFTADLFEQGQALSLGLEVQEIAENSTWKKNNIHQIIKDKGNG